jgi:hypothetical protein
VLTAPPPPGGIRIFGVVASITATQIVVQDEAGMQYEIAITPDTVIMGEPVAGDFVHVEALVQPDNTLVARYIEVLNPPPPPGNMIVVGTVVSASDTQLVVQGQGAQHEFAVGEPQAGDWVYVEEMGEPGRGWIALYIEVLDAPPPPGNIPLFGVVASITDTQIGIEDPGGTLYEIAITSATVIIGEPDEGDLVRVEALIRPDGSLEAVYIEVLDLRQLGVVQALSDTTIQVDGQQFNLTDKTKFAGSVTIGSHVDVWGLHSMVGSPAALYVQVMVTQEFRAFLPVIQK